MVPGRDRTGTAFSRTGASIRQSSLVVDGCSATSTSNPAALSWFRHALGSAGACAGGPLAVLTEPQPAVALVLRGRAHHWVGAAAEAAFAGPCPCRRPTQEQPHRPFWSTP
jgi:hypothetical protein